MKLATIALLLATLAVPAAADVLDPEETTPYFGDEGPARDPFRVLIVPKCPPPPPDVPSRYTGPVVQQPTPPPQVAVTAFGGEDGPNLAVLEYDGQLYLVDVGWESPDGRFIVKEIAQLDEDAVRVRMEDRQTRTPFSAELSVGKAR